MGLRRVCHPASLPLAGAAARRLKAAVAVVAAAPMAAMLGGGAGLEEPLPEVPLPGTALAEELDQKLLIVLRDGRKLLGVLRSFDQFANLVVEGAVERIIVGEQYGDIPLGLQVIRGENVVLLGRVDPDKETPQGLTQVSAAAIKQALTGERELNKLKSTIRARMDFLDLE